ncbi:MULTISPECIES: 16S rRNA (cytosine(1402)-N(4))-methyltransferase RsmH [Sphingomonas]|uniref:Ribosomal RNA small subunit methyltransferase H n=2 Tax=Sphingomonas hankookensis TaxID=563996 RepID=A0ABR5YGV3_9SPHN|nr:MULTISPECIES: 16S rRNA (cytosine(1402)-N(4))-methyltransferase RsmH [Sphingomonas]KZE18600.1 ribosomal RNA small subunit methyltransferase H [Sphingomonas hankookensis]PZT94966.1 MAG: 16S rRNA (cytosine(1402)-N(4))-methyltransferase RsmH [Sphingomonas sp.]RSV33697.1 16S rRNA (cytosine(1402)-N(4))-methyltransferase RsmH [Sphingomonas sp. ABOLH]WCP70483.1 16S rRNA (cytosine(1402)-N(4))-methyltransferase RsmH [Sphingomonas hankookensis]
MSDAPHIPVLMTEAVAALAIQPGETHVDATFGAGGYTRAMLAAGARVIAFDRDPTAHDAAAPLLAEAGDRLTLIRAPFSAMASELAARGIDAVDGVVMDIGVSSMQLDQADRGFSFQQDGPLDMRMSREGITAAEWLNTAAEAEISDVLDRYGEEPRHRRVANFIVGARPLARTGELAAVVRRALGHRPHEKKDPATRAFQAIRIHLNDELGELTAGLDAAERVLRPGGRLSVVSFHSLEDRIVKRFLRERGGAMPAGSRHRPVVAQGPAPSFTDIAKAVRPSDEEVSVNPRARSATLRVGVRTASAPWSSNGSAMG